MAVTETSAPAKKPRWTFQWKELYEEVITSGLCTGCAGCVIACPHDVIGYKHEPGQYTPFHLEEELGLDNCTTARRAARAAPGLALGFERGNPKPTNTSSAASARPTSVGHLQGHPARTGVGRLRLRRRPRWRTGIGHSHLVPRERHHRRRARLGARKQRRRRSRWLEGQANGGHEPRRSVCAAPEVATPTQPTRWHSPRPSTWASAGWHWSE